MGKTISISFKDGKPVSKLKDPKARAEAEAVGAAFLKRPGAVVAVPNPALPEAAKEVVEAMLDRGSIRGHEERARYDPEKLRRRVEQCLGWKDGEANGLSFDMLREAVKSKSSKLAHEITSMLRTGDHLLAGEPAAKSGRRRPRRRTNKGPQGASDNDYRGTFADAPMADSLLDRAFRRATGF